jgi:hypothetical protein
MEVRTFASLRHFFAVVLLIVAARENVSAQGSDDERLRAALDTRHQIVGSDGSLGSARAIAALARQYLAGGLTDLGKCRVGEVRDTPAQASGQYVNTFAVQLRGDDPCGTGPAANLCRGVRNTCLTIGTSIFCDYDYLVRLRNLARSTYFYAHMGAGENMSLFLPSSPDLLADFGRSQMALSQAGAERSEPTLSASERGASAYAQKVSSMMGETMEFLVMGHVIGHEVAHVMRNACGDLTPRARVVGAGSDSESYYQATCDEGLSRDELEADLLGIQNAAGFLDAQWKLHQLGYSDDAKDPGLKKMWGEQTALSTLSLLKAFEYLLIVGGDASSGVDTVSHEPDIDDLQAMLEHYFALGYRRARQDAESRSESAGGRHMFPSYRSAMLLNLAGMKDLYARDPDDVFHAGLRVLAYDIGHLTGLQQFLCGKSLGEARTTAIGFVQRTTGIK